MCIHNKFMNDFYGKPADRSIWNIGVLFFFFCFHYCSILIRNCIRNVLLFGLPFVLVVCLFIYYYFVRSFDTSAQNRPCDRSSRSRRQTPISFMNSAGKRKTIRKLRDKEYYYNNNSNNNKTNELNDHDANQFQLHYKYWIIKLNIFVWTPYVIDKTYIVRYSNLYRI